MSDEIQRRSYWYCEECDHKDHIKPMPSSKEAFYNAVDRTGGYKCPKCKSLGYHPVAW